MAFTTQERMGEIQLRHLWLLAMDENGNLDYTPEEEYADEMWNELNKKSESRKQQATHKM